MFRLGNGSVGVGFEFLGIVLGRKVRVGEVGGVLFYSSSVCSRGTVSRRRVLAC